MKKFVREKYTLKEYKQEQFMMEIVDEEKNLSSTKYSNKWEDLYMQAKEESAKGKKCSIWSLIYEFE